MGGLAAAEALANAAMPGMSTGVHAVGIPSVASTTTTTCPGCAACHACACSSAPCSAGPVGVSVNGPCIATDFVIAALTPGRGAISPAALLKPQTAHDDPPSP